MYKEKFKDGSVEIEVAVFNVPMCHEDFHEAEGLGMVYAAFVNNHQDYWDDCIIFCKPEHVGAAQSEYGEM